MSSNSQSSVECLYCHQSTARPIGPEPDKQRAGKCPECGGALHVWCWHVYGGCARPGCRFNPKTRNHDAIPYEPARIQNLTMFAEGPKKPRLNTGRWEAFEKFESAYQTSSDRQIAAAWNDELFGHFEPAEKYRATAEVARQCVQTLERLGAEYRRQHWESVVETYAGWREHFDSCRDYLEGFSSRVADARKQIAVKYNQRLKTALEQNDDEALEKIVSEHASNVRLGSAPEALSQAQGLTPEEHHQVARALERLRTVRVILQDLAQKDTQRRAVALYDENLDELHLTDSKLLGTQDRLLLYEARRAQTRDALRDAIVSRDDVRILAAASAALAAGWTLKDATLEIVREAGERHAARSRVLEAVTDQERLIAYDDVLTEDRQFPVEQREAIESARRLQKPLLALRRAIRRNDVRMIATLVRDPVRTQEIQSHLAESDKNAVGRMQTALRAREELGKVLRQPARTEETLRQIVDLAGAPTMIPYLEPLLTTYEIKEVRKAQEMLTALDELKRLEQAPDMPYLKLAIAKTYHKVTAAGGVLPPTGNWSKVRAALEFEQQWSALTRAIEAGDEAAIFAAWNPGQLHEALDLLTDKERETLYKALNNTSRRERLRNAFDSHDESRIAFAKGEIRKLP